MGVVALDQVEIKQSPRRATAKNVAEELLALGKRCQGDCGDETVVLRGENCEIHLLCFKQGNKRKMRLERRNSNGTVKGCRTFEKRVFGDRWKLINDFLGSLETTDDKVFTMEQAKEPVVKRTTQQQAANAAV